jgi:hypothetical protein
MIPILGIPILTRPELLWKMLRSIDTDVGEIIVIDNGDCIHEVPEGIPDFTHVWPGYNMGVSASWNHVIKMRTHAPWWALAGFDVEFAAGDLARLGEHMEDRGGMALLAGFNAFGLDRNTVRSVGLFDENFVPAYFEDNDYDYRARLAEIEFHSLPAGLSHQISSTLRSSAHNQRQNQFSFPLNWEYFRQKWGGNPNQEVYKTPFDAGGNIRDWVLNIDRLADQNWSPDEEELGSVASSSGSN